MTYVRFLALALASLSWLNLGAVTIHRSFRNGYPAEFGAAASRRQATELSVSSVARASSPARPPAPAPARPPARPLPLPFAPTVVATPPENAVRDLCRTADGEIRHYGRRLVDGNVRPVYLASRDNGLNWRLCLADKGDPGAMVKSPWSGEWLSFKGLKPVTLVRSKKGPGDTRPEIRQTPWRDLELRQLVALKARRRWLAAFSDVELKRAPCYQTTVAYSDDDGRSWTRVDLKPVPNVPRQPAGDSRPRWFNNGCEPSLVELRNGAVLLVARTSGPHAAFCSSTDGGATWGDWRTDSAFWQSNTMPLLHRLADGRLLFVWNNTAPYPTRPAEETPEISEAERKGIWETVFTNRDALHAAISDDDGQTWRGFREIALNEARNAPDFRELGNFPDDTNDKSVHQTQALDLPGGKVLLAYGQNSASRRLAIFDPDWLTETSREEDFRHGLGNVSHHLYVKSPLGGFSGWGGHCACNRMPGVALVRDDLAENVRRREVVRLCRVRDPRLVSDRPGMAWNFPAARRGCVTVECRLEGEGFRLTLADHWLNPCDEFGPTNSPFSVALDETTLGRNAWRKVTVAWNLDSHAATLAVDGKNALQTELRPGSRFGLSYLHVQTLAETADEKGVVFRKFAARAE